MIIAKAHSTNPGKVRRKKIDVKCASTMATTQVAITCRNFAGSLIQAHGSSLWTSSLLISEKFGKRHGNVIRKIERLDCSEEFRRLNFELANFLDEQGKPRKSYDISRDGFSRLAMGFTGPGAAKWQELFIKAFRKMESELLRIAFRKHDHDLKIASNEKCSAALLMTDCLVDMRRELGKCSGPHNFIIEHSLCNWALTGKFGSLNPNDLDFMSMRRLTVIRRRNSVLILKSLEYDERKKKLRDEFPLIAITILEVAP
jgi:Rha family phage regulatory protein